MLDAFANNRVLIVDDEEMVRKSFVSILAPPKSEMSDLFYAAAKLFGEEELDNDISLELPMYVVEEAQNGERAVAMVRDACAEGRPYAVIFLDMRMPGMDGLETIKRIREIDQRAEIVFVTARSPYSIEYVVSQIGPNVGYHLKPFASEEIKQVAAKAVYEWNKLRSLERVLELIGSLGADHGNLESMLSFVLRKVMDGVGSESAMILEVEESGAYRHVLGFGAMADPSAVTRRAEQIAECKARGRVDSAADLLYFQMGDHCIVAQRCTACRLRSEQIYLMELFTRHAGQAIENARLQAQLLHRERLAAIGMAMSSVAHDLRNPIGAIRCAVELIQTGDEALRQKASHIVIMAADNALCMVEDIVDYSRNAPFVLSDIAASALVQHLKERLDPLAWSRKGRIEWSVAHPLMVRVNLDKLTRAIVNLVQNAFDALGQTPPGERLVFIDISADAAGTRIEVRDKGPGIPAAIRGRIFEPFFTFGKHTGTGLGLGIVQHIAKGHGGSIELLEGEGARFVLRLPPSQRNMELGHRAA